MFLKLDQLQARDLVDKGSILDAQDPALVIKIGAEELNTSRIKHAGVNADFQETFDVEVDDKAYADGTLEVEVEIINRGFCGKKMIHVGKGKASLKSLIPTVGAATTFSIDLTHYNKSGDIKKGTVKMTGTLTEGTSVSEANQPAKVIEPVALERINDDAKEEMLLQTFGDVGELLDDYHCALVTSFIRHGRLFITTKHLCFYSKLFGKEMKVRIPYQHVTAIKSSEQIIKINRTLVVDAGVKTYKFHSFWDFDVAFKSISHAFDVYRGEYTTDETTSLSSNRSNSVVEEDNMLDGTQTRTSTGSISLDPAELFKLECEKSKYKHTVLSQQTLPISLQNFAAMFIDDNAPHTYKAYHESVKDTNVVLTNWQSLGNNYEFGREMKFFKPVNLPGLASTRGVKLQNYKKFGEVGLLLSSSTRLEDVPAADTFSVDDTLEVTAVNAESVSVTISFQVTFIKSTFLRSMIEGPTNSEMKKWLNAFFENLKKKIAAKNSGGVEKPAESAAVAAVAEPPAPAAPPLPAHLQFFNDYMPMILAVLGLLILFYLSKISSHFATMNKTLARLEDLLKQQALKK